MPGHEGVSLLKPATRDPGRRGDTRCHRPASCTRSYVPLPPGLPIRFLPTGEASSSLPSPGSIGPCLAAPRMGFSVGSSRRQLCGSSAYGGNRTPSPPAWLQCPRSPSETCCLSLPWCVAALPCFSRFLFCVGVSGGETGGKPAPGTMSIPPLSAFGVISLGSQRGNARWRCGVAGRVPRCGHVLCCRSVVVPVNHSLLDCPTRVLCFGVGFPGLCLPSSPGATQLAGVLCGRSKKIPSYFCA